MNNLITTNNGNYVLDNFTSNRLAYLENQIKELKAIQDAIKESIQKEMEEKGIIKIENDELSINYIAESYRETFDSKSLKKDNEDLYNSYIKISPVKASVRIKIK